VPGRQFAEGDGVDRPTASPCRARGEHVGDQSLHLVKRGVTALEVRLVTRLPGETEVAGEHVERVRRSCETMLANSSSRSFFAFDPALVRLPLRDVAAGGEEPVFALHVDATDLHLHRESRAVGTPERRLQPVRLAHLQALPDVDRLRRVHVRVDPDVRPSTISRTVVAELGRHHRVRVDDLARLIVDVDHVRRVLVEGLQPSRGAFEIPLTAAFFGHVAGDAEHPVELAVDNEPLEAEVDDRVGPDGKVEFDRSRQGLAVARDQRRERIVLAPLAEPRDERALPTDEFLGVESYTSTIRSLTTENRPSAS